MAAAKERAGVLTCTGIGKMIRVGGKIMRHIEMITGLPSYQRMHVQHNDSKGRS